MVSYDIPTADIATPAVIALRLWIFTSLLLGAGTLLYGCLFNGVFNGDGALFLTLLVTIGAAIASLPVLLALIFCIRFISRLRITSNRKLILLCAAALLCTLPYGLIGAVADSIDTDNNQFPTKFILDTLWMTGLLFACSLIAMWLTRQAILQLFADNNNYLSNQTQQQMETEQQPYPLPPQKSPANKILTKAIITGALILLMLIPTMFVSNLVTERQQRQQEVVKEVTGKWATEQTVASPYLYIPYTVQLTGTDNKTSIITKGLILLPENLHINGRVIPEIRPRSIYKVLLYKSELTSNGNFAIQLPKDIHPASLQLDNAKICFGITDFKGIEERVAVDFNSVNYELSPGLPSNKIDAHGLSVPILLKMEDLDKSIPFSMQLKLKGSEQLHFVPLSGNSTVALSSSWGSPSFDGNNLPGERNVSETGFTAKWIINKANLPFGTVLRDDEFDKNAFAFGVSMLQPADQYAKTMRSVKYAILFIGLTFSLFFIVELMQKRPLHPVQYVLVGLALVIFYTLLLSLSEFILFDQAYAIASLATILLITFYAKGHFRNWKTASLFAGILTGLYGFIFILIRLEDTAFLVGSIGLFIVLALVMYASRKINWYNDAAAKPFATA